MPTRFLPHDGRPERILAQLGLDADGIQAAARRFLVGRCLPLSPLGPRPLHRQLRAHVRRRAGRHHDAGPARAEELGY